MCNTVLTDEQIEIYISDIHVMCDQYINSLPDENMIYKSTVFSGMLNYLYRNKIRFIIEQYRNDNNLNHYNNNYELLDCIFNNIYIDLCSRYNIVPSIIQFSVFVNIDNAILSDIKSGIWKNNGSKVNSENSQTVKKWYNICESMLLSKATNENSIGSIFALKSNYGYVEKGNEIPQLEQLTQSSPEQIQQRYKDAKRPELPVLEELTDN